MQFSGSYSILLRKIAIVAQNSYRIACNVDLSYQYRC